jgi:hypothetical protein
MLETRTSLSSSSESAPPGNLRRGAKPWTFDPAELASLRRHPRFVEALRATASMSVMLYRGSRLTNLISNDRGRFVLALAPLYFHYTRRSDEPASGLTATRLKQFAVEQGVCSPGRTAAMIALMRWAGMIAPAPAAADRRVRLLVPTDKLIDMHRERWLHQLQAASLVLPELADSLAHFDHPAFAPAFAVAQTEQYLSGFRFVDHAPELSLFIERNAGLLVLASILLAAAPGDGMPPREPVTVSAAALARQFHVSRTHVITLLRDAVAAHLLEREGSGHRLRMLPDLREATEKFFAAAFLYNRAAANVALRAATERRTLG